MGIKHLTQLLKNYFQKETNIIDSIWQKKPIVTHSDLIKQISDKVAKITYIDGTYFLIQFYNATGIEMTEDKLWLMLDTYLKNIDSEHINFFLDIHYLTKLDYAPKYIIKYYPKNQRLTKEEMIESIPFVLKSKVLTKEGEINLDKLINYSFNEVINLYEFRSRDFMERKFDINDFISVPEISRILSGELVSSIVTEKILALKRAGWNRYLVKKLGKYHKTQDRIEFNNEHVQSSMTLSEFIKDFPNKFQTKLSKDVLSKTDFFGCAVDAELALTKHLKTYNKHTYPCVITCDTDMLSHLCNIDCKMSLELPDMIYEFNPKQYWNFVFKTDVPANIIKTICCLLGTDYNYKSKLYIKNINELLTELKIKSFKEINLKLLLGWIEEKCDELKLGSCHTTILAINIFLSEIESTNINLRNIPETIF